MKTPTPTPSAALLASVLTFIALTPGMAGGPLTPSGPPSDPATHGRSLTEIYDAVTGGRTLLAGGTSMIVISQPGSYRLTGNITVASGNAINIISGDVQLDLNGFTLRSTAATASGRAIHIADGADNIRVRNGSIRGGYTPPGAAGSGGGFLHGVVFDWASGSSADNLTFEDLNISGINSIALGNVNPTDPQASFKVVVARRVSIARSFGGIAFVAAAGNTLFGKVIDCQVSCHNTLGDAIAADIVLHSYAHNGNGAGGGTSSSGIHASSDWMNNSQP